MEQVEVAQAELDVGRFAAHHGSFERIDQCAAIAVDDASCQRHRRNHALTHQQREHLDALHATGARPTRKKPTLDPQVR